VGEARHDPLTGPDDPESGGSLLSRISTQMVRAMKQYYGKGPVSAKSYLADDLLFVVMRGGVTQAEQTMLDAGHQDSVRRFRQEFEDEMGDLLTSMVERLTGRHVINYQSQILFDPDMSIEMFVFDEPADPDQLEATVQAIQDPAVGVARNAEVGDPGPPPRG
jgi:uncharacterized protein YbcI